MATNERWTGWIGFAGLLLVIIAMIDFFEGLIAIIRGSYYAVTPNQIIVFDTTTWGWLTLIWAVVIGLTGFGLLSGSTWARWTPGKPARSRCRAWPGRPGPRRATSRPRGPGR